MRRALTSEHAGGRLVNSLCQYFRGVADRG
jgi:hypothetical protein